MSWKTLMAGAALSCGLAVLAAGAPVSAGPQPLTNDDILRNLTMVVFGSEFVGQDAPYVRKWRGPMRVAVLGDAAGRYDDLVDSHLAALRRLTGLDIVRVPQDAAGVNARIVFLGRAEFRAAARARLGAGKPGTNGNLSCFAVFKTDANGDIFAFDAVIPQPVPREEAAACIIEEVTQILGLPNDSYDIHPTIFNDDDEYHRLTWQDELMVRVLYDPGITPRMGRADFTAAARKLIAALRPEGGDAVMVAAEPAERPVLVRDASYQAIETMPLARGRDQQ